MTLLCGAGLSNVNLQPLLHASSSASPGWPKLGRSSVDSCLASNALQQQQQLQDQGINSPDVSELSSACLT